VFFDNDAKVRTPVDAERLIGLVGAMRDRSFHDRRASI
jgi:hypothetical protein